jgi:hypothetical protein
MLKIEQRVCMKFWSKLGESATEILEALVEYFLSLTAVFEWHSRFKAHAI